ncbi:hypothetical protein [Bradyrhizobium sp. CCGUVB23]|uniref:hypothetical protein n=1 Tax=Bradyrhizobium sp. CCGUVB23 TaxID=2949630 RepID=UPI0020B26A2D|nr:hypothetical protein [Bradyrhizobium sp. CCGUVB23]MCP3459668.1 hypothetical protein [Bradyrhizobium sp. CCGUVB23]
MVVKVKFAALREGTPFEYLTRFALGGLATVVAGVVADLAGPAVGGLMLAFPAIFCASATLIEKHERERKQRKGLQGARRGKQAAALDATGAGWGSVAMGAFGLTVLFLAAGSLVICLLAASLVWLAVAVGMFRLRRECRRTPPLSR